MFRLRRQGSACPFCSAAHARPSRSRGVEWALKTLFITPWRCRQCHTRFWCVNVRAAVVVGTMLALAVLAAWCILNLPLAA
jgi:hypothetical protein